MIPEQYLSKIRQSPNRPHLWGGMEYQATLTIVFICAMTMFLTMAVGHPFYGVLEAYILWKSLRQAGLWLVKKDPRMIQVALADMKWKQDFYPCRPIVSAGIRIRKFRRMLRLAPEGSFA